MGSLECLDRNDEHAGQHQLRNCKNIQLLLEAIFKRLIMQTLSNLPSRHK